MKVFFKFDILFPKGRVASKNGNADVDVKGKVSIDKMKRDTELVEFLSQCVNAEYKTGTVLGLEILDIKI